VDFRENAMKSRQGKTSTERTVDLISLAEIVEQFRGKKVVLYGDFVADEFQYGDISRVSREAPVLILKHARRSLCLGVARTRRTIWRR